jgi:hypothetical protein
LVFPLHLFGLKNSKKGGRKKLTGREASLSISVRRYQEDRTDCKWLLLQHPLSLRLTLELGGILVGAEFKILKKKGKKGKKDKKGDRMWILLH